MFNPDNLRELFEDLVAENFKNNDEFLDAVEENDFGTHFECTCSVGESVGNGEIFIIDFDTGKYVNWYKLSHIGRSASTNVDSKEELEAFFKKLGDTYKAHHLTWEELE